MSLHSARAALVPATLAAVAAATSGFTLLRRVNYHDEGLVLEAAARMADGEWPYADFWWNYGPGQPLLLAAAEKVVGPSLLTWRVVRVGIDALVAVLAYRFVRQHSTLPLALAAFAAVAGTMALSFGPGPNPPALALALAALVVAPRRPAVAGAMAGVAALFRPEVGLAAGLGVFLAAGAGALRAATVIAFVALALYLPFVVAAGPADVADSTIGFALDEERLQRLPVPVAYHGGFNPKEIFDFYYPDALLVGLGVWGCAAALRRPPREVLGAAPLAVAGAAYLLARPDSGHLILLAVALPLLLAPAAAAAWRSRQPGWALLLSVPLTLIALHAVAHRGAALVNPPTLARLDVEVADGVRVPPVEASSLEQVSGVIAKRVPPGRPLFVANPRHDLVRVGNTLLYVLLDRRNPTRYDVMQPGVVTSEAVQREIVGDLARRRPPAVVRWLAPTAQRREPNGAGRSSGVRILDRFLVRRYREVRRVGDYAILTPRGNWSERQPVRSARNDLAASRHRQAVQRPTRRPRR